MYTKPRCLRYFNSCLFKSQVTSVLTEVVPFSKSSHIYIYIYIYSCNSSSMDKYKDGQVNYCLYICIIYIIIYITNTLCIVMYFNGFHSDLTRLYIFFGKALLDCKLLKLHTSVIKEISMETLL